MVSSNLYLSKNDTPYHQLFYSKHPKLLSQKNLTKDGVLVLGPARSGTSWLSEVLSYAENIRQYLNEPLFHVHPPLPFDKASKRTPYFLKNDHTSAPYVKSLYEEHPLWCAYKSFLNPSFNGVKLLPNVEKTIINLKSNYGGKVLIKEVHALLATEGLISHWEGSIIMICRNPLFVVDSLLHYRTIKAHMWRKEAQHICKDDFLKRFFPKNCNVIKDSFNQYVDDGKSRVNVIMSKVLVVAIINFMLQTLAKENKKTFFIQYEELCENPQINFEQITHFCGLQMGSAMENLIHKSTTTETSHNPTPYSLFRKSANMTIKPLKFIKNKELESIKSVLQKCGLRNQLNSQ